MPSNSLRDRLVEVALEWRGKYGHTPIIGTILNYDAAQVLGMSEEDYAEQAMFEHPVLGRGQIGKPILLCRQGHTRGLQFAAFRRHLVAKCRNFRQLALEDLGLYFDLRNCGAQHKTASDDVVGITRTEDQRRCRTQRHALQRGQGLAQLALSLG